MDAEFFAAILRNMSYKKKGLEITVSERKKVKILQAAIMSTEAFSLLSLS